MMAVNDLAESAFGGVTAQLEVFGLVGLAHAVAVSDVQQNRFLTRPVTKRYREQRGEYNYEHPHILLHHTRSKKKLFIFK